MSSTSSRSVDTSTPTVAVKVGSEHLCSIPRAPHQKGQLLGQWLKTVALAIESDVTLEQIFRPDFDKIAAKADLKENPAPVMAFPAENDSAVAISRAKAIYEVRLADFKTREKRIKADQELYTAISSAISPSLRQGMSFELNKPDVTAFKAFQLIKSRVQKTSHTAQHEAKLAMEGVRLLDAKNVDIYLDKQLQAIAEYRDRGGLFAPSATWNLIRRNLLESLQRVIPQAEERDKMALTMYLQQIELYQKDDLLPGEDELTPEPAWLCSRLSRIKDYFQQLAASGIGKQPKSSHNVSQLKQKRSGDKRGKQPEKRVAKVTKVAKAASTSSNKHDEMPSEHYICFNCNAKGKHFNVYGQCPEPCKLCGSDQHTSSSCTSSKKKKKPEGDKKRVSAVVEEDLVDPTQLSTQQLLSLLQARGPE